MKLEIDRQNGVAYLALCEISHGEVHRTVTVHPALNLDFDRGGALLGIEFLNEVGFSRIETDDRAAPPAPIPPDQWK